MSLSSTATSTPVCTNCGAQRAATDFRCADCGRILSAMLQAPSGESAAQRRMTPVSSDVNLFKRLFTSQGRLGRLQYFLANLILGVLQSVLSFVVLFPMVNGLTQALMDMQLNPEAAAAGFSFGPFMMSGILILVLSAFSVWSFCCLASQRSHDLGLSGSYCLFSFVPLLNLYWALRWWFSPGQVGPNAYGPDPLATLRFE